MSQNYKIIDLNYKRLNKKVNKCINKFPLIGEKLIYSYDKGIYYIFSYYEKYILISYTDKKTVCSFVNKNIFYLSDDTDIKKLIDEIISSKDDIIDYIKNQRIFYSNFMTIDNELKKFYSVLRGKKILNKNILSFDRTNLISKNNMIFINKNHMEWNNNCEFSYDIKLNLNINIYFNEGKFLVKLSEKKSDFNIIFTKSFRKYVLGLNFNIIDKLILPSDKLYKYKKSLISYGKINKIEELSDYSNFKIDNEHRFLVLHHLDSKEEITKKFLELIKYIKN